MGGGGRGRVTPTKTQPFGSFDQESGRERTLPPGLEPGAGVSDPSRRRTRHSLGFISKKNIRSIQHRPSCSASRMEAMAHLGPPMLFQTNGVSRSTRPPRAESKLSQAVGQVGSCSPGETQSTPGPLDDEPEDHRNGARECPRLSRGRSLALQPSSILVPLRASSPRTQESQHWKGVRGLPVLVEVLQKGETGEGLLRCFLFSTGGF